MLIGIDANEANNRYRAGIGRYAHKILESIYLLRSKQYKEDVKFRIYLSCPPLSDMPEEKEWWEYVVFGSPGFWIEKDLVPRLWMEKFAKKVPDVFWSITHYAPIPSPVRSFISIMDLAYLQFPKYFKKFDLIKLNYWTKLSLMQARGIFTISNFTKSELEKFYPSTRDKIKVAYPGFDIEKFNPDIKSDKNVMNRIKKQYDIRGKYILYLGTAQPRKNLKRLIQAFAELEKIRTGHFLVIAGMVKESRGGWMYEEIFTLLKKLGMEKKIIITGFIKDEDIPYLISGSEGLVLPSLYEGFGIPVIEAMALNVPVAISRNSSLTEAGGKVAIYIDNPYNNDSIKQALVKLLTLPAGKKEKIIREGQNHIKQFSWGKAAEIIMDELIKKGK
jgi:glycosyltransferase involved in cell wall biosynthesis